MSREKDKGTYKYYLTDHASNGTFVNTTKVGKGNKIGLKDGDEITLLKAQHVTAHRIIFPNIYIYNILEMISFIFKIGAYPNMKIYKIAPPKRDAQADRIQKADSREEKKEDVKSVKQTKVAEESKEEAKALSKKRFGGEVSGLPQGDTKRVKVLLERDIYIYIYIYSLVRVGDWTTKLRRK